MLVYFILPSYKTVMNQIRELLTEPDDQRIIKMVKYSPAYARFLLTDDYQYFFSPGCEEFPARLAGCDLIFITYGAYIKYKMANIKNRLSRLLKR